MAIPAIEKETASIIYHWPPQGEWTYADYARLPDDSRRYEVIGGNLYVSPVQSPEHQQADAELMYALMGFFKTHDLGRVYSAPIDVLLPDMASPVQPDIIVILREQLQIVKRQRIEGVPDLVIEILSPGSLTYDRRTKYDLYAAAGVKEYWILTLMLAQPMFSSFAARSTFHSAISAAMAISNLNCCPIYAYRLQIFAPPDQF